jgi:hypothetical protein
MKRVVIGAALLALALPSAASANAGDVGKATVNAGPIWNQADAARKCPAVASGYGGTWDGQWRTTEPKTTSVCEIAYVAASVETSLIANQAAAGKQCVAVAKANGGMWDGRWRTTVPGGTSVCDLRLPTAKPAPNDMPPLAAGVNFKNFDYAVSPCGGDGNDAADDVPPPVHVRAGTYAYNNAAMGTAFDVSVAFVQRGSLQSGTQQALVVLSCEFPIGGTSTSYLYDVAGTTAVLLGELPGASWGGDWGSGPNSIHTRFANDFLYVDACGRVSDCKTRVVTTYALRGGKLVQVWKQTH